VEKMDIEEAQYISCLTKARFPALKSQHIFFGFPLPQYHCSHTKEAGFVVEVFTELLYRAAQEGGWFSSLDQPISYPDPATRIARMHELELQWGTDVESNRRLLKSFTPKFCVYLIRELLRSFPTPVLDYEEISQYSVPLSLLQNPAGSPLRPIKNERHDKMIFSVLGSVGGRPQGDILDVVCNAIKSFSASTTFCSMLTHNADWLEPYFYDLAYRYDRYLARIEEVLPDMHHPRITTPWTVDVTATVSPVTARGTLRFANYDGLDELDEIQKILRWD